MHLKRRYDANNKIVGVAFQAPPGTPEVNPTPRLQKLTMTHIFQGMQEGWLQFDGTLLTYASEPAVRYKVITPPGYYCCSCQWEYRSPQPEEPGQIAARAHVASEHAEEASPDPQHPGGYRRDNFFLCQLES